MRKIVSVVAAGALAATSIGLSFQSPIQAQDAGTSVKMYFKVPLGGEAADKSLRERGSVGFQLNHDFGLLGGGDDWRGTGGVGLMQRDYWGDQGPPVIDFSFNQEGLAGASFMGADATQMLGDRHNFLAGDLGRLFLGAETSWFPIFFVAILALALGIERMGRSRDRQGRPIGSAPNGPGS